MMVFARLRPGQTAAALEQRYRELLRLTLPEGNSGLPADSATFAPLDRRVRHVRLAHDRDPRVRNAGCRVRTVVARAARRLRDDRGFGADALRASTSRVGAQSGPGRWPRPARSRTDRRVVGRGRGRQRGRDRVRTVGRARASCPQPSRRRQHRSPRPVPRLAVVCGGARRHTHHARRRRRRAALESDARTAGG